VIDFNLPQELVAKQPVTPRDSAKLLVYNRANGTITDAIFSDLPHFLPTHSTLVLNNSKVEHCRWLFAGGIEIFVLQKLDTHTITAMIRKGKKFLVGSKLVLTDWLIAEVLAIDDDGYRTIKLNVSHDDPRLTSYEHIPLPPYIPQNDALADDYQTVYAKPLGSKAAPTAGLHFTDALLKSIAASHDIAELTLHVGLGTFAPLTKHQLDSGHLHAEHFSVPNMAAQTIASAQHITAVGTTTVRTLETLAQRTQLGHAVSGSTDILIIPPYHFTAVQAMVTNFHLPGTSLLLLVEAFTGSQAAMQKVYAHAVQQKYRFYSFGDAMLIL
jgi:S-adenosylmethionine:tRNA ribosyltransferase-isomerase